MKEEKNIEKNNKNIEEKEVKENLQNNIQKNEENNTQNSIKNNAKKEEVENKNSDLTFKRVEVNTNDKKTKTKNSHTFLKVILFIIMLIIVAYCIFFARNCLILTELGNKIQELDKKEVYSFNSISKINGDEDTTNIKYARNSNNELFEVKIGENVISMWEDKQNNRRVTFFPTEKVASIASMGEMGVSLPVMKELKNDTIRSLMSIASLIYSDTYEGTDCYVIMLGDAQKTWVEKETGLVKKREYETYTVEYTDVQLDNIHEITEPDLYGYKITEK